MKIAILEDDWDVSDHLQQLMEEDGHQAVQFTRGGDFLTEYPNLAIDLLLLDWGLPDMSGTEVVRRIRGEHRAVLPVIMVTSRFGVSDIVEGFASGADDFVSKPVIDNVLRARIEAVARRAYGRSAKRTEEVFGQYAFNLAGRQVSLDGAILPATEKEFALALLFFRNLSRPLSRAYISEIVWGQELNADSRTLDSHISYIRGHLHIRPENGYRLSAIHGFGYRLEPIGDDRLNLIKSDGRER